MKPGDIVNPINTTWTLLAAFLVFGMQVGFTMLEAGFCRSRETVNVLMECIVDTCLVRSVVLRLWLMRSCSATAMALSAGATERRRTQSLVVLAKCTADLRSDRRRLPGALDFPIRVCRYLLDDYLGAMIGRTGFVGDLLYSVGVSGFIYPIIGHWTWGPDGFLYTMGTPPIRRSMATSCPTLGTNFHDFAGSTVVHTIGGFIALAGSIVLGPRLGRKFKRDGGGPMLPHDLTIAASGGLILWFGWYGFNPGSTLSAMDLRRHRPCCREYHAGRLCRRSGGDVYGVDPEQEVGRELHG